VLAVCDVDTTRREAAKATVEKRFSRGLSFLGSYVLSKQVDNVVAHMPNPALFPAFYEGDAAKALLVEVRESLIGHGGSVVSNGGRAA